MASRAARDLRNQSPIQPEQKEQERRRDKRMNPLPEGVVDLFEKGVTLMPNLLPELGADGKRYVAPSAIGNFGAYRDGSVFRDLEVAHPALYKQIDRGLGNQITKDLAEETRRETRLAINTQVAFGKTSGVIYVSSPEYKIPAATIRNRTNGEVEKHASSKVQFTQEVHWRVASTSDPKAENPVIEYYHGWVTEDGVKNRSQEWSMEPMEPWTRNSEQSLIVTSRGGR